MTEPVKVLSIPPDATELGGTEIFRAFVVDGGLSVSFIRAFEDPSTWGVLLVDVIRHLRRTYAKEDGVSEDEVEAKIVAMMSAELGRPTDLGATSTINH
ncbi:MAG: DUF5076 domain-containing protein [Ancalomicrobiaceae bacterium]|nr:DUF5076 domain-containing protein [Ancalomicrobiaceae bacterium]